MTTMPPNDGRPVTGAARRPALRHPVLSAALGLAFALSLAGCGGRPDDGPAGAQVRATASTSPQASLPLLPRAPQAEAPRPATPPVAPDELAELKRQVLALQHELADVRRLIARGPVSAAAAAEPQPDPRRDAAAREAAERAEGERIAGREAAFRGEPEDLRWGRETSATVRNTLAQADADLQSRVRNVECRSRSCRVEISAGAAAGAVGDVDLPILLGSLATSLPNVSAGRIDQGDGRQATVLYLSR